MIDHFTKQDFERVLKLASPVYRYSGLDVGEHIYLVPVDPTVGIMVRSSIRQNNQSADTGADSIRLWLFNRLTDFPIGKGATRFITRRPGWEKRLIEQIELLKFWRKEAGDCPVCGKPKSIHKAGENAKPQNVGKIFANCSQDRNHKAFQWIADDLPMRIQIRVTEMAVSLGTKDSEIQFATTNNPDWVQKRFQESQESAVSLGATSPEAKEQTNNRTIEGEVVPSGAVQPTLGETDGGLTTDRADAGRDADSHHPAGGRAGGDVPDLLRADAPCAGDDSESSTNRAGSHAATALSPVSPPLAGGMNPLSLLGKTEPLIDTPAFIPQKDFTPSRYQEKIFEFVRGDNGNAVVEAVAGSGKTTTLVKALAFTDPKAEVGFVAFNKHIAKELAQRATSHVHVSTLHALGFANARAHNKQLQFNEFKLWDLWDTLDPTGDLYELKPTVIKLCNLVKATLRTTEPADLDYLIDRYNIEVNGDMQRVYELVPKLCAKSLQVKDELDYGDMIYWCAWGEIPCQRFDVLFVDEAQDFNAAQRKMALNSIKANGRIIAVGDRSQSIMGFQGADTSSIPNFIQETNATTLPLSICYRCHKSAVRLAQTLVPQIEWREDAPEGIVSHLMYLPKVKPGDLVLCRLNAPLVKPCFDLIRHGIKATIKGRSIGNGLIQMLLRGKKLAGSEQPAQVLNVLSAYVTRESNKLWHVRREVQAEMLLDQYETLLALSDGTHSFGEIKKNINTTFSDDKSAVEFATVHKAKGLEAERVYILHPELMPFPKATRDWEMEQEKNIQYVSWTRPKQELYFVEK